MEKYDDGGVYGDLDATVFRHRFVIHVTDPNRIMETKTAVDNIPGIDKARADEAVANGFTTVRNVAGRHLCRADRHTAVGVGVHHQQYHQADDI